MGKESLQHRKFHVAGRLFGLTRRRVDALTRRAGGELAPLRRASDLVVAHGRALQGGHALPIAPGVTVWSEIGFRRLLGLAEPADGEQRTMSAARLAGLARLPETAVGALTLFDALDPVGGLYGYRDLACARQTAKLLQQGVALNPILHVAATLRRRGTRLCEAHLVEAPWGEIVQSVGGTLLDLDGQFELALPGMARLDDIVASAEASETAGDLAEAERLYHLAMRMDKADPVLAFNLGNVLDARGRPREAEIAYRQAIARDRGFADARYNLAISRERAGALGEAEEHYRGALSADPSYRDAMHNLALLLTRAERYGEALPLWEDYIASAFRGEDIGEGRRMAQLCRIAAQRPPSSRERP